MSKKMKTNSVSTTQRIHNDAIVVDTHNDILFLSLINDLKIDTDLEGQAASDLARWKEGGVDVQVFALWCEDSVENPYDYALQQLDLLDELCHRNPAKISLIHSHNELLETVNEGKLAALIGVEGGHMIENDLQKLEHFFQRGARYLTLTWNNSTDWASSAYDEVFNPTLKHKGLNEFGRSVIHKMNELGMLVDVSHIGEQTFWDVIECSSQPIIASHSCVSAICPTQRNLTDQQIKAIANSGGVIQVNFYSEFLDPNFVQLKADFLDKHRVERDELINSGMISYWADDFLIQKYTEEIDAIRAPLSLLIDHIEYIINLVGIDYVGLGSDFDGMRVPPLELNDVTSYPLITNALLERGYNEDELAKILGANFLRVLAAVEK